jgi:hypothetical protein
VPLLHRHPAAGATWMCSTKATKAWRDKAGEEREQRSSPACGTESKPA